MLRSILIGLDGSPYSEVAQELGIRWARQFDATLVGLAVIDEPTIRGPEPVPLGGTYYKQHRDDARMHEARVRVERFLARFTSRCTEAGVSNQLLEGVGLPWEQVLLESQRYDLILLGQQTYFHFETQDGPCETLQKVLGNMPRPVVAVPRTLGSDGPALVAYDGSLQATRSLQAFQALKLYGREMVHIVSVAQDHHDAARHAERAADFLRFHQVPVVVHASASAEEPGGIILEQARSLGASLIVMGAYGQPFLREFFLGSVTRTLLGESTVPLFLYH